MKTKNIMLLMKKKYDELEDRINENENTILDLQRELRNFKKKITQIKT